MDKMTDSIFVTIKKMLGLGADYTPFDAEIMVHINSVILNLTQMGIGPKDGFMVLDYNQKWSDFLPSNVNLEAAKTYIYLQVKMLFDPPTNSFVMDSYEKQSEKMLWRLNVQAESVEKFDFMHEDSLKRGGSSKNIIDIEEESAPAEETTTPAYNGLNDDHSIDIGVLGGG